MVEAKPRAAGQYYEHLAHSVTEGLIVLDEQGVVTSANAAAAALLGYAPDALVGHGIHEFWLEPNRLPDLTAMAASTCEDTLFRHRNGRSIPVTLTTAPLPAAPTGANILLTITSLDDVAQLNNALARTQRLASIGTLTASIAHELNTPISIIAATCRNLVHEIEDETLDPEQLLRYVEMIEQSAWRSARILQVLRNYSYDDAPQFAVTNIATILEDALTLVRHQFRGELNIRVEREFSNELKTVMCDHNRVTQVVLNLLNNASDAMGGSGGVVRLQTWAATEYLPDQNGRSGEPIECFSFSVSDSGHGIDPEIMDRIFDPFFTTKQHGKGTGLGLYIAKRIVEQHNGRITAANNEHGGATFTVTLPRKQNHE